jgi:mannose/cellobiose epimerase-like protein (N-acyl-D-glucosamine 2-epimerase family)
MGAALLMQNYNMANNKYQVLSPDGFTIERDKTHYSSKEKAIEAYSAWAERYKSQGYYSSAKHGRIYISDLYDYCQFNQI